MNQECSPHVDPVQEVVAIGNAVTFLSETFHQWADTSECRADYAAGAACLIGALAEHAKRTSALLESRGHCDIDAIEDLIRVLPLAVKAIRRDIAQGKTFDIGKALGVALLFDIIIPEIEALGTSLNKGAES